MKTVILCFVLLMTAVVCCPAQVYVGPVAGGQLSWTKFDEGDLNDAYKIKPVWGYHAGMSVSMKVRNRFFLNSSLVYSVKGRKIEGKLDPLLSNHATYRFIEMPIVYAVDFRGRLGRKEFKYYAGVGPNVSYWLGGRGKLYNSDLDESTEYASRELEYSIVFRNVPEETRADEMNVAEPNRIQLGLNVATGVVFEPQPNHRVLVLLRYELGHSFLSRTGRGTFEPTYYTDELRARNKGFRLSFSYLLDLRTEDRKRGKSTIRKNRMK